MKALIGAITGTAVDESLDLAAEKDFNLLLDAAAAVPYLSSARRRVRATREAMLPIPAPNATISPHDEVDPTGVAAMCDEGGSDGSGREKTGEISKAGVERDGQKGFSGHEGVGQEGESAVLAHTDLQNSALGEVSPSPPFLLSRPHYVSPTMTMRMSSVK